MDGQGTRVGHLSLYICISLCIHVNICVYIYRITDFGKDGADWTDGSRMGFKKAGGSGGPG